MALDDLILTRAETGPALPSLEIYERAAHSLQEIKDDPSSFIDEGGAATVHNLPGDQYCIKVLHSRHNSPYATRLQLGNTVEQESSLLERLNEFSFRGVRTPYYVGRFENATKDGFNAIIMERLTAVNFQHVLNGSAPMPKTFNKDVFFDSLEAYMDALHSFQHIAHLDLEPRNIMIDAETGLPRVIDLGRARSLAGLEKQERARFEKKDLDHVDSLYTAWETWKTKKMGYNTYGGVKNDPNPYNRRNQKASS